MSRVKIKTIKSRNRYIKEAESVISVRDDCNNYIAYTFNSDTKKLNMFDNIKSLQDEIYGKMYTVTYIEDLSVFRDKQIDKILKNETISKNIAL